MSILVLERAYRLALARKAERREAAEPNTHRLPRGESLRRELRAVFRQQREAVLRFLRTGRKADGPNLPPAWPDWNDFGLGALKMSERMTPLLTLTWEAAAAQFAPRVGLDPNEWDVVNPHTERMIQEAALAFCDATNQTTSLAMDEALKRTREELHAGVVDKGESVKKLTDRISAVFDRSETWRARRIAQTETSRAVHAAQEQAAIVSGVVTGWSWLLSSDACPLCHTIARRAPAVRLGQPFAVIGDNPHFSQIKFPPAHPHCNCTVTEVLDTDPQPKFHDTLHQPQPEPEPEPRQPKKPETLRPKPAVKPKPAAPKVPSKPKPAGPPVSDAIEIQDTVRNPLRKHIKATLDAIDKLHGDGNLDSIPLNQTADTSYLGAIKIRLDGKPVEMLMSGRGGTPRLTMAHETGHLLDYAGIPSPSRRGQERDFRGERQFEAFIRAVEASASIKTLRTRRTETSIETDRGTCQVDQKYVRYLLQDNEIWARAYAQYVATRSSDGILKDELKKRLDPEGHGIYPTQWKPEDFEPIAEAIDGLVHDLGWRK